MRKKLKERTSWHLELGIYNTVLKDVLQSVSGDRVEDTKASYPNSGAVKDSRDGGPNESEEVVKGVGDVGLNYRWGHPYLST